MADPERRWWKRSGPLAPAAAKALVDIVAEEDFVSCQEAAARLGLRMPWINSLGFTQQLRMAATTPPPWYGDVIGFTRESVDREAERWQAASPAERRQIKWRLLGRHLARSV